MVQIPRRRQIGLQSLSKGYSLYMPHLRKEVVEVVEVVEVIV